MKLEEVLIVCMGDVNLQIMQPVMEEIPILPEALTEELILQVIGCLGPMIRGEAWAKKKKCSPSSEEINQ